MESIKKALAENERENSDKAMQRFLRLCIEFGKSKDNLKVLMADDSEPRAVLLNIFLNQGFPMAWRLRTAHVLAVWMVQRSCGSLLGQLESLRDGEWPFDFKPEDPSSALATLQPQLAFAGALLEVFSARRWVCEDPQSLLGLTLAIVRSALGRIELQLHALGVLKTWWRVFLAHPSRQRLHEVLGTLLALIVPIWDSHFTGLPNLVLDMFQAVVSFVFNASEDAEARQRIKEFCSAFLAYPAPCKTVLTLARALLLALGSDHLETFSGNSLALVGRGLRISYCSNASAELFADLCRAGRTEENAELEARLFSWMCDVVRTGRTPGPTSADLGEALLVRQFLPPFVRHFPCSGRALQELCCSLLADSTSSRLLTIFFSILRLRRSFDSLERVDAPLLLVAVSHVDCAVQLAALESLCLTAKASQPTSEPELRLILAGFAVCLTSSSPAVRHRLMACWKALLLRTRDACVPHLGDFLERCRLPAGASEDSRLLPDLATDWLELERNLPPSVEFATAISGEEQWKNLVDVVDFTRRLVDSRAIFPGSCYQRQATVMEFLDVALAAWLPTPANTKTRGFSKATLQGLQEFLNAFWVHYGWSPTSPNVQEFLLESVLFSNRSVQEQAMRMLFSNFTTCGAGPALHRLRTMAERLCDAPQAVKFQSGARILRFVFESRPSDPETSSVVSELLRRLPEPSSCQEDILEAARNSTGLGFIQALADVDPRVHQEDLFRRSAEIFDFAERFLANMMRLMGCDLDMATKSAPSFEQLGVAIMHSVRSCLGDAGDFEECPSLPPEFQHVMSWAWNGIKVTCELLVTLARACGTLSGAAFLRAIGQLLFRVLTLTRHRGTIEAVSSSFEEFCRFFSTDAAHDAREVPRELLEKVFVSLNEAYSVTRRSAGLPLLLKALLLGEAKTRNTTSIDRSISRLLALAADLKPTRNVGDDSSDPAAVHALNLLRGVLNEAGLAECTAPHHSRVLRVAVRGFLSPNWSIRNSSLQLFSTLSLRMVGVNRPVMLLTEFFALYPDLADLFDSTLTGVGPHSDILTQQAAVPILALLARLSPDPQGAWESSALPAALNDSLMLLLHSPILVVRRCTTKALLALSPVEAAPNMLRRLLTSAHPTDSNGMHGWALLCQLLLQRSPKPSIEDSRCFLEVISEATRDSVKSCNWFLARELALLARAVLERSGAEPSDVTESFPLDDWVTWLRGSDGDRFHSNFASEATGLLLLAGFPARSLFVETDSEEVWRACALSPSRPGLLDALLEQVKTPEALTPTRAEALVLFLGHTPNVLTPVLSQTLQKLLPRPEAGPGRLSRLRLASHVAATASHFERDWLESWFNELEVLSDVMMEEPQRLCAVECLLSFLRAIRQLNPRMEGLFSQRLVTISLDLLVDECPEIVNRMCDIMSHLGNWPQPRNHILSFRLAIETILEGRADVEVTSTCVLQWRRLLTYLDRKFTDLKADRERKVLYETDDVNVYREYRFVSEALFSILKRHCKTQSSWTEELDGVFRDFRFLQQEVTALPSHDTLRYAVEYNFTLYHKLSIGAFG